MGTVWDSLRRRATPKAWNVSLWHSFHIPACSFISWLAFRKRLLTKERMRDLFMNVDQKCVLCNCNDEDTEHLFLGCPYSYLLLRECPFSVVFNWNSWMRGIFFHDNLTQFEKDIGFLYINVVIYLVWRERNDRLHNQGTMRVGHLGQKIKRMVREKLFSCTAFKRRIKRDPTISHLLY